MEWLVNMSVIEMASEQIFRAGKTEVMKLEWRKSVPSLWNTPYKDTRTGVCLSHTMRNKEVTMLRADRYEYKVPRSEIILDRKYVRSLTIIVVEDMIQERGNVNDKREGGENIWRRP